jgi:3'-5' exoribonuclease
MPTDLDLRALTAGARVNHELLVRERQDKTTKGGDPFVALTLGNASGTIAANVWKEHVPALAGVGPGAVVQVIGEVEHYQGRPQLKLSGPPRVVPVSEQKLAEFLPRISGPVQPLWDAIDGWRAEMPAALRAAVDTVFGDDEFRRRFERAPGATRGHHAQVGGLLQHTVEVATIARASVAAMGGDVALVTAGALLHDIGKVDSYEVTAAGFEFTQAGRLVGHIVLGSLLLQERLRALPKGTLTGGQRLELHHFIQSHHGIPEYGAAVRPMTLEAELLHYADQASAKGNDFTEAARNPELFPGEQEFAVRKDWRLERIPWRRPHDWS